MKLRKRKIQAKHRHQIVASTGTVLGLACEIQRGQSVYIEAVDRNPWGAREWQCDARSRTLPNDVMLLMCLIEKSKSDLVVL